jgi:hypothetical protein
MAQTTDNVGMAHTVERDCFVLEILNQRSFQLSVRRLVKKHVERLDHDCGGRAR